MILYTMIWRIMNIFTKDYFLQNKKKQINSKVTTALISSQKLFIHWIYFINLTMGFSDCFCPFDATAYRWWLLVFINPGFLTHCPRLALVFHEKVNMITPGNKKWMNTKITLLKYAVLEARTIFVMERTYFWALKKLS